MSADRFILKRGTTSAVNAYLPEQGEPVYDTTLKQLRIGDGVTLGGVVPSNALSADKLTTARTISLTGPITGSVSFDGSANVSISTSVGSSLQSTLDSKAPLASPTFTGVPAVPTPVVDTNTTQAASTAFVVGQAGSASPLVNGTVSVGTSLRYARQDHVHPIDTSRAPLASPNFTGNPTAPTAAAGDADTSIANTFYVQNEIAAKRVWTSYTPVVTASTGSYTLASATGSHMGAFGMRNVEMALTVTTKGTGVTAVLTLPVPAHASWIGRTLNARQANGSRKMGVAVIQDANTVFLTDYINADMVEASGAIVYINGAYREA